MEESGVLENVRTLGQIALEAYAEARRGVTFDGRPIPVWAGIGDDVRNAWEAAALAVVKAPKGIQGLTEREEREVQFSLLYASQFNHGTDGHNAKLLIAKLWRAATEGYVPVPLAFWPNGKDKADTPR
jgi:hypothetical protein